MGPDPYGHHINLTSFKTSMTLKFVIILEDLIKTRHRKSGKSKCDRKVTELNVEITRIRSRVNGVSVNFHVHDFKRERLTPSFAIYNDETYFRLPSVLRKTSLA